MKRAEWTGRRSRIGRAASAAASGLLVATWVVCLGLSWWQVAEGMPLGTLPVTLPRTAEDHPQILGPLDLEFSPAGSAPARGDLLIRYGESDVRGLGRVAVAARAWRSRRAVPDGYEFPLIYRRAGVDHVTTSHSRVDPLFPGFILLATVEGLLAILVKTRAPDSPAIRAFFAATMLHAIFLCGRLGESDFAMYSFCAVKMLALALVAPLALRCVLLVPRETAPESRWPYRAAWLTALPAFLAWHGIFELRWIRPEASALLLVVGFCLYAGLSLLGLGLGVRNYVRAGPLGRRQLRWVLPALVLTGLAAAVQNLVSVFAPAWSSSFAALTLLTLLVPVAFAIGIVRYNLFDIDRLLSATASYNVVLIAALGAGLVLVPRVGETSSEWLGLDPRAGQIGLSLLLAAVVVPMAQRLRPRVDSVFFRERHALEQGIAELLPALAESESADALAKHVGDELHHLLQPRTCVLYARGGTEAFLPVFVAGRDAPAAISARGPLVATLRERRRPLSLSAAGRRPDARRLDPFDQAALAMVEAEVVVPVVVGDALQAFICLGPKRSGDVYTSTDLAHLASVAQTLSDQLRRFAGEAAAAEQSALFRREGDVWTIFYAGKEIRLRDMRGLHYLATLLREPGREFHASDLVAGSRGAPWGPIEDAGLHVGFGTGDAGGGIDGQARAAYRARLGELEEETAEAERMNDLGRLERASAEREALTAQLGASARGRRASSDAERARVTATKGIKAALDRIAAHHPELSAHLQATIRRGYFCSYVPDPRHPIEWTS